MGFEILNRNIWYVITHSKKELKRKYDFCLSNVEIVVQN